MDSLVEGATYIPDKLLEGMGVNVDWGAVGDWIGFMLGNIFFFAVFLILLGIFLNWFN